LSNCRLLGGPKNVLAKFTSRVLAAISHDFSENNTFFQVAKYDRLFLAMRQCCITVRGSDNNRNLNLLLLLGYYLFISGEGRVNKRIALQPSYY